MISSLHIENIAVIESADISFDSGFHVLTGETGAGKSIVIDSINAILGERTYRDIIRTGSDKGYVSAIFTGVRPLSWFETYGVPQTEELLVQREISLDGKNICRVNGKPVTVATLRELGRELISIHGQHDSQQLFDEATHLQVLDAFAENQELLADYREAYRELLSVRQAIRQCTIDESEKIRRKETLEYQIKEISRAKLQPGEDEDLEARRTLLRNAEKISDSLQSAYAFFNGGHSGEGAMSLLEQARGELSHAGRFLDSAADLSDRIREPLSLLEDINAEIDDLKESLHYSDEEMDRVEDRLEILKKLKRKYGSTIEEIIAFAEKSQQELDMLIFSDERADELKSELEKLEKVILDKGNRLRESRKTAAVTLERAIQKELSELDMPKVRFCCDFEEIPAGDTGLDLIRFLMSANEGEALKPMSKVASGGELARIMLAIKNVMSERDSVETLIFDEVDTGISGRAAQKVAMKLKKVSAHKQVLCVSHLPQLAAAADVQLLIAKDVRNGRTYTSVTELDINGRIEEISRIIGGAEITANTRKSAEDMLNAMS